MDFNKALEVTADFVYNDLPEKLAEIYKSTESQKENENGY